MSEEVKKELEKDRDDMNKAYPAKCCFCGKEVRVCKSLGMLIGWLDIGSGTCPSCGKRVKLKLDRENDEMTIVEIDEKHFDEIEKTTKSKLKESGVDLC